MTIRTNGSISNLAGTGPVSLHMQSANKAWCHWIGTGTIAINGSFNVSSIVDEATGQTELNFTNSMDTNSHAVTFSTNVTDCGGMNGSTIGTGAEVTHQSRNNSGTDFDAAVACMICTGDLA